MPWAGRFVSTNSDRTLKKMFNTKPDGVRRGGRRKLRWENGVDVDVRMLEAKNWKKVALDRDEWAKLLNTLRTGDAYLRFYITTVQDG